MGKEIDQLNYKVILDDEAFNSKIVTDLETARTFNRTMSEVLEIKKRISSQDVTNAKNAERINREQQKTAAADAKQQEQVRREQQKTTQAAIAGQERIAREQQKTASQAIINSEKERKAKLQTIMAQERLNILMQQGNSSFSTQSGLLRELGGYAAAYFSVRTVE